MLTFSNWEHCSHRRLEASSVNPSKYSILLHLNDMLMLRNHRHCGPTPVWSLPCSCVNFGETSFSVESSVEESLLVRFVNKVYFHLLILNFFFLREFKFGQMQRNASARCDCLEINFSSKCQKMEAQLYNTNVKLLHDLHTNHVINESSE